LVTAARGASPDEHVADSELLAALQSAIAEDLSVHQREVLVAVTLNGVPIDVLAERLKTTRGAVQVSPPSCHSSISDSTCCTSSSGS